MRIQTFYFWKIIKIKPENEYQCHYRKADELLKIGSFQSTYLLFEAESRNYSTIPWRAAVVATINTSNAPAEFPFIVTTEIQPRRPLHGRQYKENAVFM